MTLLVRIKNERGVWVAYCTRCFGKVASFDNLDDALARAARPLTKADGHSVFGCPGEGQ